jgi:hypothetical protein
MTAHTTPAAAARPKAPKARAAPLLDPPEDRPQLLHRRVVERIARTGA